MANRILISDTNNSHAVKIRSAISTGYGSDISADVGIRLGGDIYADINDAWLNGFVAFIHTASAVTRAHNAMMLEKMPAIQGVFGLGSNDFVEITTFSSVPFVICCGAGDTQNRTAYGNGLEFWDDDNEEPGHASSFSSGVILGKLLKIKDDRGGSWWDARYAARQTASNNGTWSATNGYGQINVESAVLFAGTVIVNPYLINTVQHKVSAGGRRR